MNPEAFRRIVALIERRVPLAVATVVGARGSVPGKLGARMLVLADGTQEGTVGGAGLEAEVKRIALAAIANRSSGTHRFELSRQKAGGLDSVCGGGVEVFVEYIAPRPHLLVCGGGHVGLALARLCDQLDYAYSVADVRPEFASPKRFPNARARFPLAPEELFAQADLTLYSHLLVVGHSHQIDGEIVCGALERRFAGYLGVIGSETKRREFRARALAQGIPETTFDAGIVCPIGLAIEAETPAEIAVAVLAEVIQGYRSTTPRVPSA